MKSDIEVVYRERCRTQISLRSDIFSKKRKPPNGKLSNSVLKPFPETGVGQTLNATHMVQMQNLKTELLFITDGNGLHNSCMTYK